MNTLILVLVLGLLTPVVPQIDNATVLERPVDGRFKQEVADLVRGSDDPSWIGWSVPKAPGVGSICCGDACSHGGRCRLHDHRHDHGLTINDRDDHEPDPDLQVLLETGQGKVTDLRLADGRCLLDAGGHPVVWLTGVEPGASVELLAGLLDADTGSASDLPAVSRIGEHALVAIALHDEARADQVLIDLAESGQDHDLREQAAFWLGVGRGRVGFEALRRLLETEQDGDLRSHLVFALSQSEEAEATELLLQAARQDRDPEVREQALFWLAQEAGVRALATITEAAEHDPDLEVREHALFALSQLDDKRGFEALLRIARSPDHHPELRKQAFFWLGQSDDQRALDLIEEILTE